MEQTTICITREFAFKCAEALVDAHNHRDSGSPRLFSFRDLYKDLQTLGFPNLIASALHPTDFPKDMWFS